MSMLGELRKLLTQLKKDPLAARELLILQRISTKTLGWMVLVEAIEIVAMYPAKYFFDGITQRRPMSYMLAVIGVFGLLFVAESWFDRQMEEDRTYCFW